MLIFSKPDPYSLAYQEPEFIDFAEERLELGYDYGMVGGAEFKTEVIEVADGRETRNSLRHLPLGRWQLGQRVIADSEADKLEEVSYLLKFHEDRKGAKQGFRFKDWADYRGVDQVLGTGDGLKTEFQLRKAYLAGSAITYRPIQKPVFGTVDILVNGVNVAIDSAHEWIVNHQTGVISNPTPLDFGAVLTANFHFDVPVWFETDEFSLELDYYDPRTETQLYQLGSIFVVEGRLPLTLPWEIGANSQITEDLNLGIVYQTNEKFRYHTNQLALANGFTQRESKREAARILFDYGDRKFLQKELDALLGYFWNARGKAGQFPLRDKEKQYLVRFDADQLNIKFEAANQDDALFQVSGLKLQLKEEVIFQVPPFTVPLEQILINPQDPDNTFVQDAGDSYYQDFDRSSFAIASYQAEEITFDQLPPNEQSASLVKYQVRVMFWGAGALNILVGSSSSSSSYRNRLIHYRLNSNNGWDFEYQSTTIFDYILSVTDINSPSIHQTSTGTSIWFRANDQYPLGTSNTATSNGLLRLEIKNDGSSDLSFIPGSFGAVRAVYGDSVYTVGTSNSLDFLGEYAGLNYYASNFNDGFPIASNTPEAPTANNIWVENSLIDNKRIIRNSTEELFSFTPRNTSNPPDLGAIEQGSYLIKILARGVCEDGLFGCSNPVDLVYFYLKESWFAVPELIDIQKWLISSTAGDSHYLQTYNSSKKLVDKYGNILIGVGNKLIYYRSGSSLGVNIAGQLDFQTSNIRIIATTNNWGFAAIAHDSRSIFDPLSQIKLIFVQNQKLT